MGDAPSSRSPVSPFFPFQLSLDGAAPFAIGIHIFASPPRFLFAREFALAYLAFKIRIEVFCGWIKFNLDHRCPLHLLLPCVAMGTVGMLASSCLCCSSVIASRGSF